MPTPNFQNRTLYHGDNLAFLRGMNSETVHLVATDPPFNKSRDFHATPDSLAGGASFQDRWSWRDDIHYEWLTQIRDGHPEVWNAVMAAKNVYGSDMGAFLCFMGVRLLEMRRVLRSDGSIYIHIDSTAHAYIKMLMDAVFGRSRFRDAITWNRSAENLSRKKFRRAAEVILYYSKGSDFVWNPPMEPLSDEQVKRDYRYEDERGRYSTTSCTNNANRPNMVYEFNGNTRQWRYSQKTMMRYAKEGMLVYNKDGIPRRKRYLADVPGKLMTNVWSDIKTLASNSKERTGYPTQKPLALYERIIKASSNEGDIVLDPFCGCATTPVAAEKLKRKWVGMDLWDKAHETVLSRFAAEGLAASEINPDLEGQARFGFDAVHYETEPPARTDGGDDAVADIQTPTGRKRARHPRPRSQHGKLLEQFGAFCQGCGRDYSFDPRVLEVDHIRPKSDGGSDAYDNLTLLCPPCNRVKMDRMTLTGLQRQNRTDGHLLRENEPNLKLGRGAPKRRRR